MTVDQAPSKSGDIQVDRISRRAFLKMIAAGAAVVGLGRTASMLSLFDKNSRLHPAVAAQPPCPEEPNPITKGTWNVLGHDSKVLAIHAALLRTGKVIFISGSGNSGRNFDRKQFLSAIWDYPNAAKYGVYGIISTKTDLFCCGHSFLPDGKLLVAGGTSLWQNTDNDKGPNRGYGGSRSTYILDAVSEKLTATHNMQDGRWYPTLVTLGNGNIFTISGYSANLNADNTSKVNQLAEVYSDLAGWTLLRFRRSNGELANEGLNWPLYPHVFLLHDSRLFYTGGHVFPDNWNKVSPGWIDLDLVNNTYGFTPLMDLPKDFQLHLRDQSSSVLLPPAQDQKIMIIGGGSHHAGENMSTDPSAEDPLLDHPPIRDVHIIDLLAPVSNYTATEKLNFARMQLNAVLLPDRTVFVCGGDSQRGITSTPQMQAEIYNPSTQKWTIAATACIPRLYHSVALLLPDARVLTAGSNPGGAHELRLEIYNPPYLFHGRRPVIDKIDQDARYGMAIHIDSPQASSIKWVHLIRPMATTHSYDSEQRLVDLSFSHGSNQLIANIPDNPNLVPPGWYMLFIVEALDEMKVPRGIPSIAKWVRVFSPP